MFIRETMRVPVNLVKLGDIGGTEASDFLQGSQEDNLQCFRTSVRKIRRRCMFNVKEETSVIQDGISRYFKDRGMTTAIVGISGGKDSSVVASLCCNVLGAHNVAGVMMPNGEQKDMADSLELVKFLNMKQTYTVNIGKMYSAMSDAVPMEMTDAFRTNAPARLRMCVLYGLNKFLMHW